MAHPRLLGDIKNIIGCVDSHKGLRDNKEIRKGETPRFISYTKPFLQDWEKWLLHLMHRDQQRESQRK